MRALLRMLGLRRPGRRPRGPRPVSVELNRSFAIAITSVGVVAGIATAMLGLTTLTMNDVIDELSPLASANRELFVELDRASDGVSALLTDGDEAGLRSYERAREAFPAAVARAQRFAGRDAQLQGLIDRQVALAQEWFDSYGTPAVELAPTDVAGARAIAIAGERTLDRFREANLAAGDAIEDKQKAAHVEIRRTTFIALSVVVVIGILGMAVALLAAVRARRRITGSLEELVGTLDELRTGDLSARSHVQGPAEVARTASAVNAMADEISHLQDAQARRMHEQRALGRLSREILSHLRAGDVLKVAAEQISRTLEVDRTVIRATGPMGDGILAQWNQPGTPPVDDLEIPPAVREMVKYQLETFDHLAIDDVRTDPRLHDTIRTYYEAVGSRALLIRGVLVRDQAYGVIAAHSIHEPRAWSEFDRSILELASRELGLALEHSILYEQESSMVVELQQLDQAKDDFVSSISHELRTPLASILGYTELLRDGDAGRLTPDQDAMLSVIERNTGRLHDLIEDLLTLSVLASDTDDLQLTLTPTDVGALISDAIAALRPTIADHGLELRTSLAPNLPRLLADRAQLERVLLNLLTNAVKFSPDGGTIEVAARTGPGTVVVVVSDTGIGIEEDEQADLFTRFFRASGARQRDIQGTGLGLVIVRSIIEQHGGTVALTSAVGVGTTVTITLPVPPI